MGGKVHLYTLAILSRTLNAHQPRLHFSYHTALFDKLLIHVFVTHCLLGAFKLITR